MLIHAMMCPKYRIIYSSRSLTFSGKMSWLKVTSCFESNPAQKRSQSNAFVLLLIHPDVLRSVENQILLNILNYRILHCRTKTCAHNKGRRNTERENVFIINFFGVGFSSLYSILEYRKRNSERLKRDDFLLELQQALVFGSSIAQKILCCFWSCQLVIIGKSSKRLGMDTLSYKKM